MIQVWYIPYSIYTGITGYTGYTGYTGLYGYTGITGYPRSIFCIYYIYNLLFHYYNLNDYIMTGICCISVCVFSIFSIFSTYTFCYACSTCAPKHALISHTTYMAHRTRNATTCLTPPPTSRAADN